MTRQTPKNITLLLTLLGLVLSASGTRAQVERLAKGPGSHTAPRAAAQPPGQTKTPGSPSYRFTLLNYPGAPFTFAEGINPAAKSSKIAIVGGINTDVPSGEGGFLAKVSENKTVTEIYQALNDPQDPVQQNPAGINDSGDIAGVYVDSSGNYHGYEKTGGKFIALDVPFAGASNTEPYGINNSGEIVGAYIGSDGHNHAFTYLGGTYASFDYPGAVDSFAIATNSSGVIVGQYADASGWHGFELNGGTYTPFDVPGATETFPGGINDTGVISGFYCSTDECVGDLSGAQGFVLSEGAFTTIAIPGEYCTVALGINNNGAIVGFYQDAAGLAAGFLATP
jgi:probable HAF family extracellular repeat protein